MNYSKYLIIISLLLTFSCLATAEELIDLSDTQTNTDMATPLGATEIGDLNRIQEAFNDSEAFNNTLIYQYNKRSTYKIRLRTAMDTLLILPVQERILIHNFGDDVNFNFQPLKNGKGNNSNMGIIKNLHSGADTNLIVIGSSGNSYNFYLRIDDHSSNFLPHLKVFVEDKNIISKLKKQRASKLTITTGDTTVDPTAVASSNDQTSYRDNLELGDYLKKIDNTPMRLLHRNQDLDFRYTIFKKGNVISPKAVFDDGFWTYFRMSTDDNLDKISELPVILKVVNGVEQPVNSRVARNYLIAETTGSIFALRVDDRVLCIEKTIEHKNAFIK